MTSVKEEFDHVINLLTIGTCQFVAVDVKTWEDDSNCILEVGVSLLDASQEFDLPQEETHFCIKEHAHLRNNTHLPDNRNNFLFGVTQWSSLSYVRRFLESFLNMDVALLVCYNAGVVMPILKRQLELRPDMPVYDIRSLWKRVQGRSLCFDDLLTSVGVEVQEGALDNAGNDVHYIMEAFVKMVFYYQTEGEDSDDFDSAEDVGLESDNDDD